MGENEDFSPSRTTSPKMTSPSSRSSGEESPLHHRVASFRRESSSRRESNDIGDLNEQSPLLQGTDSRDEPSPFQIVSNLDDNDWRGDESQETKSSWYLALLTVGGFGLSMGWSVEMSNGSPYLLSLGLTKAMLALVWIAGPLSGVLVQPYIGIKGDRSRIKWGKRRPYIIGGALSTIISLMALAWAREIVGGFLGIFGVDKSSHGASVTVMIFAVVFIYVLDFAINVLQAANRAFIVDCAPVHQQESANAWIARANGVGSIFGMFCGGINLPKTLPFLGNTQFKVLCAVAAISMFSTTAISCASIKERDPTLEGEPIKEQGLVALFWDLYRAVRRLPPQISQICWVQFMAWMGYFPFLFYTTTYIAEMYVDPIFENNPNLSQGEINTLWEEGTRHGAIALLAQSIVTFLASVFLPFIIPPTYQAPIAVKRPQTPVAPLTPTTPRPIAAPGYFSVQASTQYSTHWNRIGHTVDAILSKLQIPGLTLRRAWFLSHIFFAVCMLATFLVRGVALATVLIAFCGIPWALANWAPFALIAAEISKRDAIRRGILPPPPTQDGELLAAGEDDSADQAGVVLGIHNVAMSAPQILATLISSFIFKSLSKPRGTPGDDSVAWCLRFGGICLLAAAYLTTKVSEDKAGVKEAHGPRRRYSDET